MRSSKVAMPELFFAFFDSLFDAIDSIFILFVFNLVSFRLFRVQIGHTFSFIPGFGVFLLNTAKIVFIFLFSLLLIKRILYQVEGKDIKFKKIFSIEGILRAIKTALSLLFINITPIIISYISLFSIIEEPDAYSFLGLIFMILFIVVMSIFCVFLNFIVIRFEYGFSDALNYTLDLLSGYKIKLLVINLIHMFYMAIIVFIFIEMMSQRLYYSYYNLQEQKEQMGLFFKYSNIFLSYFIFVLCLGQYKAIKSSKSFSKIEK